MKMTPKEKAEELVNKYLMATPVGFYIEDCKKCAIIAVDEVMSDYQSWVTNEFWEQVKQEIINL